MEEIKVVYSSIGIFYQTPGDVGFDWSRLGAKDAGETTKAQRSMLIVDPSAFICFCVNFRHGVVQFYKFS